MQNGGGGVSLCMGVGRGMCSVSGTGTFQNKVHRIKTPATNEYIIVI